MTVTGNVIGVDESGKGDFFGPLVVAGLLAGDSDLPMLAEIGVRDSKRLTDKRILELDQRLRSTFVHHITVLMPDEYNRRYETVRNLNIMLADCHAETIAATIKSARARSKTVDLAISDKFGKTERLESALARVRCELPVTQIIRGESVPQVAAASILARAEFVRRIKAMSEELGAALPKGASAHVDVVGRELVARYGPAILLRVAKRHFKNFKRACATDLFSAKR
ncbi:MAG: ribonuclease HIII [Candidatus Zixiibacteriota bacterium]